MVSRRQLIGFERLATKYLLAGAILVLATVASGLVSAWTFARLSYAVESSLRDSHEILDLASALTSALEREDDALLLAMTTRSMGARQALARQRTQFDDAYASVLADPSALDERPELDEIRASIERYRAAGDTLLAQTDARAALEHYHAAVNPFLRAGIAALAKIREHNFRAMQQAGERARDQARQATRVVAAVSLVALLISIAIARHLGKTVVVPVTALTASVDAIRRGEFGRRVEVSSADELGRLGEGFNRMADALDEFRRSNLGEVLRAKKVLESTLESLPDAVIVFDAEGRVDAANQRARTLFGRGDAESPLPNAETLPEPIRNAAHAALATSARDGESKRRRRFDRFEQEEGRWLQPIAATVDDRTGRPTGAVVALYDVTEFVRLDELRSEVVAVASHELRTPLTTIGMNVALLGERSANLTAPQKEMVRTAQRGCDELEAILERFLDVTRIEAGQLRLDREHMDLRDLVRRVEERLRERYDSANVALVVELPDAPCRASGDAARLEVVLSNLLTNSLKYTPDAGRVTIRIDAAPDPNGCWTLLVADTGRGIPIEYQSRVFEKFFRVEHHRSLAAEHHKGAGLGLYLCQQIVHAHGGSMAVRPSEHGAILEVRIPGC